MGEKMGKWLSLMLVVLLIPGVMAVSLDDLKKEAGTPPDSFFYKLDRLFEKVQLLLSRSEEAKAETRLELARERLGEFKVMLDKGRVEQAEIAIEEYLLNIVYARDFSFRSDEFKEKFSSEASINADFLRSIREDVSEDFEDEIKDALKSTKIIEVNIRGDSPFFDIPITSPGMSDAVKKLLESSEQTPEVEVESEGSEEEAVEENVVEKEQSDEPTLGLSNAVKQMLEGGGEESDTEEPLAEPEPEPQPEPEPEPEPEPQPEPEDNTVGYVDPSPRPGYH